MPSSIDWRNMAARERASSIERRHVRLICTAVSIASVALPTPPALGTNATIAGRVRSSRTELVRLVREIDVQNFLRSALDRHPVRAAAAPDRRHGHHDFPELMESLESMMAS